jgi:hypothetical protein
MALLYEKRGYMSLDKVFWRVFMVKKQLLRGGIALLAVLFALGIAGCDGDSDSGDGKSSNTQLISISIAGGSPGTFSNAMAKDTWQAVTEFVTAKLADSQKTDALVTLTRGAQFKGTVEIARVAEGATAATFAAYAAGTTKFTFVHGDRIFIKMIAEDGTTRYYGAKVEIGTDAGVKSITFDLQEVDEYGTPGASLAAAVAGHILMAAPDRTAGLNVAVTMNDPGATVIFGISTAAESTWTGTARDIKFADGEFLGVKATSASGTVSQYYRISVELMPTLEIAFGTPTLGEDDYIDPLWENIEWVPIAKRNRAESSQEFIDDPSTSGQAKLLWDENGLWLMVEVTGPVSTNENYTYQGSSVELFINEGYPTATTGNFSDKGGQYRLDADGLRSGDPDAAVLAFNALGKFKAFKRVNTSGADGYTVIFQGPWRFSGNYPLKDDKDISLEIQINAANLDGVGRVGVLKWYNTSANTYQTPSVLAPAKLKLGNNTLPIQSPGITTQPAGQQVPLNTAITPLTVAATSPDGGTLSYQWYSSQGGNSGGSPIDGATTASYTPTVSTATIADFYYYVVGTNTKGCESKTNTSNVARIRIFNPNAALADIELVSPTHALWNAEENAIVVNAGGQYGTFVTLPISGDVSLVDFIRLDVTFEGFLADNVAAIKPADQESAFYDNDIIANVRNGAGVSNNFGYNATGGVRNGGSTLSYALTDVHKEMDFSGGAGDIQLNLKFGTNKEPGIRKFHIKSVKFKLLSGPDINVAFTADMLGGSGSPEVVGGGTGYKYTTTNYGQTANFKINIGSFKLADYSKISFTINSEGGDPNFKACFVLGSSTPSFSLVSNSANNVTTYIADGYNNPNIGNTHPVDLVLSIDKAKDLTSSLTGDIYLCIFINSSGCTYTITNFKIYND